MRENLKIAYIGGGSTDWAHKYFSDILSQDIISGELRLYDIDVQASENNKKYFDKLVESNKETIKCSWECKVVNEIDAALQGVDFVLISILPYSLKNMEVDVHYPEKYGIYQSVGDTAGPGGYSRALRTIDFFRFFARKIKENCSEAWVINYTNPMTICMNTLYKEFPEIKAFGCCHEVFGTQKILAEIVNMYNLLSEEGKKAFMNADLLKVKEELAAAGKNFNKRYGFKGINRHEIMVNVQGINHFTWINKAEYQGQHIFPLYEAYIKLFRINNRTRIKNFYPPIIKAILNLENVKFELFERYGIIAAAGDRHLAEFVPDLFLRSKKEVYEKGFFITPVWGRLAYSNIKELSLSFSINMKKNLRLELSGEEGVNQIAALCGYNDNFVTNVNLINEGQIPNLPQGTAVESNAVMSKNSIEPVEAGPINEEILDLIKVHALNQKEFVEAYFNQDRDGLLKVFLNDPAVKRISQENGIKLFNEMIELNANCLEDFLKIQ